VRGKLSLLREYLSVIDGYVRKGSICEAKLSLHGTHPLLDLPSVLCVYADDKTKDSTLELLLENGIEPVEWKYEWETKQEREKLAPRLVTRS